MEEDIYINLYVVAVFVVTMYIMYREAKKDNE